MKRTLPFLALYHCCLPPAPVAVSAVRLRSHVIPTKTSTPIPTLFCDHRFFCPAAHALRQSGELLTTLYEQVNPGVVSILVLNARVGRGPVSSTTSRDISSPTTMWSPAPQRLRCTSPAGTMPGK